MIGWRHRMPLAPLALLRSRAARTTPPSVVQQAPLAYVSVDTDGAVVAWNPAATETFGWPEVEVLGQDLGDLLLNPLRGALHRRQVSDFRTTGASELLGRHSGVPMSTRDGRLLRVDCVVWSTLDTEGVATLHTLMDDVSDQYAADLALQRANADLQAFSAAMAHDLRGPLTTIKGYAELMHDGVGAADSIVRIDAAADRGVTLIDDILRYLGVGRVLAVREPVDLTELLEQVVADQVDAVSRPHEIEVRPLPTIDGDPRLLAQLFGNLVGNALKYVPADRPVEVIVDSVDGDPVWGVTVRVHDNGEPIPVEDHARIFSMFERGGSGDATIPGSGVGLAVSQRIAALHDGEIKIAHGPDGGNVFCVRLGS